MSGTRFPVLGDAVFLELEVNADSGPVGAPVGNLPLGGEARPVAIRRGQDTILPRVGTRLEAGDRVAVLAYPSGVERALAVCGRGHS